MKYLILVFVLFTFSTNINQKPIVASYDKGIRMTLIDYSTYISQDCILNPETYQALYREIDSTQLYLADLKITNNILFNTDTNKNIIYKTAYLYENYLAENMGTQIVYIGSISKFQRIYIDLNTGIQYIKTLKPYEDSIYIIRTYHPKTETFSYKTNSLNSPVYPVGSQYMEVRNTRYTINPKYDPVIVRGFIYEEVPFDKVLLISNAIKIDK